MAAEKRLADNVDWLRKRSDNVDWLRKRSDNVDWLKRAALTDNVDWLRYQDSEKRVVRSADMKAESISGED